MTNEILGAWSEKLINHLVLALILAVTNDLDVGSRVRFMFGDHAPKRGSRPARRTSAQRKSMTCHLRMLFLGAIDSQRLNATLTTRPNHVRWLPSSIHQVLSSWPPDTGSRPQLHSLHELIVLEMCCLSVDCLGYDGSDSGAEVVNMAVSWRSQAQVPAIKDRVVPPGHCPSQLISTQ